MVQVTLEFQQNPEYRLNLVFLEDPVNLEFLEFLELLAQQKHHLNLEFLDYLVYLEHLEVLEHLEDYLPLLLL